MSDHVKKSTRITTNADTSQTTITTDTVTVSDARARLLNSAAALLESKTTKPTWKDKLNSRKFWMCIVGIICGVLGIIGFNDSIIGIVASSIVSLGSIVGYMISEGTVDSASIKALLELVSKIIDQIDALDEKDTVTTTATGGSGGKVVDAYLTMNNYVETGTAPEPADIDPEYKPEEADKSDS